MASMGSEEILVVCSDCLIGPKMDITFDGVNMGRKLFGF
jgi:hypothetical protein